MEDDVSVSRMGPPPSRARTSGASRGPISAVLAVRSSAAFLALSHPSVDGYPAPLRGGFNKLEHLGLEPIWPPEVEEGAPALRVHFEARGAWLSYDGIREGNAETKLPLLLEALKRCPDQLLISQDAGWYHVGEPQGGDIAPLDWLPRHFILMLKAAGVTQKQIDQLLVRNAARAFTVRAMEA